MDLSFLRTEAEITNIKLEISGKDLIAFGDYLLKESMSQAKQIVANTRKEEYIKPEELASILKVSLVTIWNWDRKGILNPIRIGRRKLYKKSEVMEILNIESHE